MRNALQIASFSSFILALAAVLVGCTTQTIKANPNTFSVRETTQTLRAPQTITVKNGYGYSSPAKETIGSHGGATWDADMQQLTDTAISIMTRHLAKNGINVGLEGEKTVTLRVRDTRMEMTPIPFAPLFEVTLGLEAQLGDGTASMIPAKNNAPRAPGRAIDGALLFAVTGLLNDTGFVGYINR